MSRFFPLALELVGLPCLVIGGGDEALRRSRALLDAGAQLTLVGEPLSAPVRELSRDPRVRLIERRAVAADLDGQWLAVFTERDAESARSFGAEARARRVFFCAVDQPSASTYAHMALARAGLVTAAISTSGRAPALGRKLATELTRLFAESGLAAFADKLAELRNRTPSAERGRVLGDAVAAVELDGKLRLP